MFCGRGQGICEQNSVHKKRRFDFDNSKIPYAISKSREREQGRLSSQREVSGTHEV